MSVSRERRDPEKGYRQPSLVTEKHRKVLRQLLVVLEDLINENEGKDNMRGINYGHSRNVVKESDDRDPVGESDKEDTDQAARTSLRPAPERENSFKKVDSQSSNVIQRYKKSLDEFTQLSNQIRRCLTSIGGGGRAAKALKEMQEPLSKIYNNYLSHLSHGLDFNWKKLDIPGCTILLRTIHTVSLEVIDSLRELNIYNDSFMKSLLKFRSKLLETAMILEVEYDQLRGIDFAGNYIEREVLDPLFTAFEAFLVELRDRVGEEVAMIRRTQDISSQRYLNLTTVATFLSSVTATTLQITAGDQQSVLSIIMNTMWFTSLVFSTASAVYSLLIMTWSRSPVRQFDSYLSPMPSWLTATLRNGPVFTLIAAVIAFSVGLCILAFQTAIQQDHIATAIVSTVFAGVHAILLLLISAWFLWEQWRAKHLELWEAIKKTFFIPRLYEIKKHRDRPRNTLWNTKESISRLFSSVLGFRDRTRVSSSGSDINTDIEKGLVSEGRIIPAAEMVHPSSDSNESGDERRDVQNNPNPELLQANPPIEVTSLNQIESDSGGDEESVKSALEHPVFQPTLQFSPNGAYSAFTHGNKVTIYDSSQVNLYFPLVQSIEVDDRRPITSITWSERNHLLVHAKRSINVWKTDGGVRSIDFSVHNLYIVDAVSLDSPRFLCLSEGTKGSFVVFNLVAETVEKTCGLYGDDHTLILSKKKDNALLQEDKNKVTSNKIENELHTIDLWNVILYHQDLQVPGGTIGFYEKDDELIYGASEYEIVILRPSTSTNKDSLSYKALHIVTSPAFTSEIALPISFSFRPGTVLYTLAYGLSDGRIKVWSIQSNMFFKDGGPGVELIIVHDRKGRGEDPRVSKKGEYFTIMLPWESKDI